MILTDNARTVLEKRYLRKDPITQAVVETPEELFERVARHAASAESTKDLRDFWYGRFHQALINGEFIPNSPMLMNAGLGRGTLSACFVLPVDDSMEGIMRAATAGAMVQKYGGGTGYSMSRIRSKGTPIQTTQGAACGAISVLEHLNDVSRLVTQGGTREGANMGVLRVDHPEIMDFINLKRGVEQEDGTFFVDKLLNFNISVGITDAFMQALDTDGTVELIDPHSGPTGRAVVAQEVWDAITENAWRTGDPGLIFLDKINRWRSNPVPDVYGEIETTNPCGEKPMHPWDSCVLGHINLRALWSVEDATFNWDRYRELTIIGVRFLDNMITVNEYPQIPGYDESPIKKVSEELRRLGLGVLGFADLLFLQRIPYGSNRSLALASQLAGALDLNALAASRELGHEKGSFPLLSRSNLRESSIRNAVRTTIAPTGTTSFILGASPGIEPNYSLAFYRQHRLDRDPETGKNKPVVMLEVNDVFAEYLETVLVDDDYKKEILELLTQGQTLREADHLEILPRAMIETFVTALEIPAADHVAMQDQWQKFIDDGVSKTVNLRNDATMRDIDNVYRDAFARSCLGVTAFRDGSRAAQVYTHRPEREEPQKSSAKEEPMESRKKLPADVQSRRHKFRVGQQEGFIHVGEYEDGRPGGGLYHTDKAGVHTLGVRLHGCNPYLQTSPAWRQCG